MEDVSLSHAKEHLEELIERARRGEDVRIVVPAGGSVRLSPVREPDMAPARVTDTIEPFVPLDRPRTPGRLTGKIPPPPEGFFDPMPEEELKLWYGDDD